MEQEKCNHYNCQHDCAKGLTACLEHSQKETLFIFINNLYQRIEELENECENL